MYEIEKFSMQHIFFYKKNNKCYFPFDAQNKSVKHKI